MGLLGVLVYTVSSAASLGRNDKGRKQVIHCAMPLLAACAFSAVSPQS